MQLTVDWKDVGGIFEPFRSEHMERGGEEEKLIDINVNEGMRHLESTARACGIRGLADKVLHIAHTWYRAYMACQYSLNSP